MHKLLLSAAFLCSFSLQAAEYTNYADVSHAVAEGKKLTFVVDFKECISPNPVSLGVASITPNAILVLGNRITASDRHFTLDYPGSRGTPIFDYSRYTLDSDGLVAIRVTVMKALDYEQLADYGMSCELGKGFKVFG